MMEKEKTKVRFWYRCRKSRTLVEHVQQQFGGLRHCGMTVNGECTLWLDDNGMQRLRQMETDGLVSIRQVGETAG